MTTAEALPEDIPGLRAAALALLAFQLAHARARDAAHHNLDLRCFRGLDPIYLASEAPDRLTYLRRPDLGRRLSPESAVRLTRMVLPQMRKQGGGSIVYSTSTSVRQPTQYLNLILSNAIRAAVQGMMKTLSSDLAKDGVRVNAVQPGRIATDRLVQLDADTARRQGTSPDEVRRRYESTVIPMGRYGTPEEYAAAVVFIASPKASYIAGVSLQVDGGMLMSMF